LASQKTSPAPHPIPKTKEKPDAPAKASIYGLKEAVPRTKRPLTIACHMKKTYFFLVVSAAILEESALILEESALILEESALILEESTLLESVFVSELALLLQAAKATPIANTKKNFFICDCFYVN
jgi:hypothetical protein